MKTYPNTVTLRVERTCDFCGGKIKKGEIANDYSKKVPVYDENGKQKGIWYNKAWTHEIRAKCDPQQNEIEDGLPF